VLTIIIPQSNLLGRRTRMELNKNISSLSMTGWICPFICSLQYFFKYCHEINIPWNNVFLIYCWVLVKLPVTVDDRSKACTVFARSEAGMVGSNPTQDMDIWYVYAFCVCVVLCLGRGLATSWSPAQGVLSSVKWSGNWESALCSTVGARGGKKKLSHANYTIM
jgi:hypothetical protein